MQRLIDVDSQLEVDTLSHRQSSESRSEVVTILGACNKPSCCILRRLQTLTHQVVCNAAQKWITVVQATGILAASTDTAHVIRADSMQHGKWRRHREVAVDDDSNQGSSERVRYFAERVLNGRSDQKIKNAFRTRSFRCIALSETR